MPRTTLDLDSTVLRELRRRGKREHKSMGQVASELLAASLSEKAPRVAAPLRWPVRHMGRPLVDLEDGDAVGRLLDRAYLDRLDR